MTDEEANTLRIQNDQLRHDAAHVLNELDRLRAERDELAAALREVVGRLKARVTDENYEAEPDDAIAINMATALLARIRATAPGSDHDRPPGSQRG